MKSGFNNKGECGYCLEIKEDCRITLDNDLMCYDCLMDLF